MLGDGVPYLSNNQSVAYLFNKIVKKISSQASI